MSYWLNSSVIGTKWKLLQPATNMFGYQRVTLKRDKKSFYRSVHILVLETFVGPRQPGMVARHFPDSSKLNNNLDNLSWSTQSVNCLDKNAHGTDARGEKHYKSVLNETQVREILSLESTKTIADIARRYNVGKTTISHIFRGDSWKHITKEVI